MGRIRELVSQLTTYQKVSAVLLAFFGVTAIFLAGLQMKTRIVDGGESRRTNAASSVFADLATQTGAIMAQDTDKDGLTDTDEIKTYRTSPYLQDSDSDGIRDGEEIANETNPNCPEGETCFGLGSNTSVDRPSTDGTESASKTPVGTGSGAAPSATIPPFNAEEVRQALRDSGIPDAQVDAVTDAELRKMYDETVAESQKKSGASTGAEVQAGVTGSSPNESAAIIAQARAILVQSGMSQAQVDALTDEEILQLLTAAAAKNER